MRKIANIAVVVLIYVAGWFAAGLLLGESPVFSPEITKWLWSVGALIIGALGQLLWKVHDSKKAEGLSYFQRSSVGRVAGLIYLRIYSLMAIVFIASIVGIFSGFVVDSLVSGVMSRASFGAMLSSAVLWLAWMYLIPRDIQRFEDRAREIKIKKSERDGFAKRLAEAKSGAVDK